MRQRLLVPAAALAALALAAPAAHAGQVEAGAAAVDASWHVGASAGQYATDGTFADVHGTDPHHHSTRRVPSYGIQSRLEARAIVVEGADGSRVALVKNDLYIPQDLLYRRTAQILEAGDSGIGRENLTMAVSHDHSSPFYSSTSWGVWTFQDVFDVRFFNYYVERMAEAVEKAAAHMKPVRVGASVTQYSKPQRNALGPAIADDGTPAGFPNSYTDHDLIVVRFDDISNPSEPKPLANLVSYSLHPEFLSGNDLISADYIGPLERIADRATGAVTIFTQSAVGTTEPERSSWHLPAERAEFSHREYAQAEYGARGIADAIVDTSRDIAQGTPDDAGRFVPFETDFDVAMEDRWFPGPLSHPYPGVSSCRTDAALQGDPRFPLVGLPDCESAGGLKTLGVDPGVDTDDIQALGIPVPENYSAPSYTGLEEDVSVHLQAFRLGDILFTVCSCEQWADQSRNIKTRTNREQGDQFYGFDWGERCTRRADGDWDCPNPQNESQTLQVTDHEYRRMRAQVNNDATGWDAPENVLVAESEDPDPDKIWGNYTHEELPADLGYSLTVPIAMANDYNGYIATYREYQRGDHYRKALTGWGPHSSDYMATRLVRMGGHLKGGDAVPEEPLQEKVDLDLAFNEQRARVLGDVGSGGIAAYEASLPDDGGPVVALEQPKDVERFAAAFFAWNGGSNYTDSPRVTVERRVDGQWVQYADQSGEVPVTLKFPQGEDVASYRTGAQRWEWTAHFEVFASNFDPGERGRATPEGEYRFRVRGLHRQGGEPMPYELTSDTFQVKPWSGIAVEDLRREPDGAVSFQVGPRHTVTAYNFDAYPGEQRGARQFQLGPVDYPDSYSSPARFIVSEHRYVADELYCPRCSFRPWADTGNAQTAYVTILKPGGRRERVAASERAGRWYTTRRLKANESAYVAAGDVRDAFGNLNGSDSAQVSGR